MQILILSDIHIARNTPWSRDWEDVDYLIRQLTDLRGRMGIRFPCFAGAILCGDVFNTPRILPGDAVRLVNILRVLGVAEKEVGWINGNHDPGDFNIAELLPNSTNLNVEPLFGMISGHSFSQNIQEVRDWLKACKYSVTITHQSASMFMNLGDKLTDISANQLRPEDFHAPVNFIGDTHVTDVFTQGEVNCISPGILAPMRSRKELFDAHPQIMVWDIPKDAHNGWDVGNSSISTIPLKKRPFVTFGQQLDVDLYDWSSYAEDVPLLVFVSADVRGNLDFSKCPADKFRIIEYAGATPVDEVLNAPLEDRGADTLEDIMATANDILPEDTPNRETVLELTKNIIGVEDPDIVVKSYLEGK